MKIVTDSGSDLSIQECEAMGVSMLPLKVSLGGKTYRSGFDLSPEQFYDLIEHTDEMPTTSTPSVGEFVEVYEKLAKEDPEIVSVHLSSGLSATYNTALTASKMVNAKITVIDTLNLASAAGWQVRAAADAAMAGLSVEALVARLKQIQQATTTMFTLPDLKYLIAGGRIGHLKGLLASLLGIKPIIEVSKTDGKYYDVAKKRSFMKAVDAIPELVLKIHPAGTTLRTQIAHAANPEGGNMLRAAMDAVFDCEWLGERSIGPALGAHTGRGLVGILLASQAEYSAAFA